MSYEYDDYLKRHKYNVRKAFEWLRDNLSHVTNDIPDLEWQIVTNHDQSKTTTDEYDAYDAYFYGNNPSHGVVKDFKKAWLLHIHRNPHHWQYWILINDDPGEGMTILDMPDLYIVEMICDWWSFSWVSGNLTDIFRWYADHSENMKLSPRTRTKVEGILHLIKQKLEEEML